MPTTQHTLLVANVSPSLVEGHRTLVVVIVISWERIATETASDPSVGDIVCHNGGRTRIITDTRLFIQIAVTTMAGYIRKRFIYIRKQRRNSGAHGGQCIIKSEH